MTRIKICGMTCEEDVDTAVEFGVDALGFILAKSPRCVTLEKVAAITLGIPPFISTVAVVADPEPEELTKIVASGLFTHIQFHGQEPPGILTGLQPGTIKAFGIASAKDLERINLYWTADYFLFDSRVEGACGGTGKPFDWTTLKGLAAAKPFILAGGLGPENVAEAIRVCRPAAVDLNSRLESEPGKKDPERIRHAVSEIREADKNISRGEGR